MTIKEGIYDIRESLNSYNIDSEMSNRQIFFLMNTYRRQIVRQFIQKHPGEHRDQLTQTLYYALENVDSSRFPDKITTEFNIRRTAKDIPNIIGQQIYKEIEVRPINRLEQEIEVMHKDRMSEVQFAPFGFIYAYIDDDRRLYLFSRESLHKFMGQLTVTAILENPEDIVVINELTTDLEDYPLPAQLWVGVKAFVLQDIGRKFGIVIDTLNDKADEQAPNTQTQN